MLGVALRLTPHGRLVLEETGEAAFLDERAAVRLAKAFAEGTGQGLVQLGAGEVGQTLPPAFVWWRAYAAQYVGALCLLSPGTAGDASVPGVPPPSEADLASLVSTAPMMPGAEYITADLLRELWHQIGQAFSKSLALANTDLQQFLKSLNPAWNLVGRVHFNLAENKRDQERPFAFMATYTTRLSAQARAQHVARQSGWEDVLPHRRMLPNDRLVASSLMLPLPHRLGLVSVSFVTKLFVVAGPVELWATH